MQRASLHANVTGIYAVSAFENRLTIVCEVEWIIKVLATQKLHNGL